MVDVRGDVLRPPHGTTPAAVKSNIKSEMKVYEIMQRMVDADLDKGFAFDSFGN